MAKNLIAERVSGVADYNLPVAFNREIGRIIVRWANLEYYVQTMVWEILGISRAEGRIAIREPRVADRLDMVNQIIQVQQATWDADLYKSVAKRMRDLASERDLVAHAIWGRHDNQWYVQVTRGAYPNDLSHLVTGSRRVMPEMVLMTVEKLKTTSADIEKLIFDLKRLRGTAERPPEEPQK